MLAGHVSVVFFSKSSFIVFGVDTYMYLIKIFKKIFQVEETFLSLTRLNTVCSMFQ